jgi:hypothetical protein
MQHRKNASDVFIHGLSMHVNGWIPAADKL